MQNEDDLRGLAKTVEFLRAISILFLLLHVYWYCYQTFSNFGLTLSVVDKILLNIQRTTGLFSNILYSKLFVIVFLGLSCLGTQGIKDSKITWNKIYILSGIGGVLFFLNWWLLDLPYLYIGALSGGDVCLMVAGVWCGRLLKHDLMKDVFNMENESFQQETRLIENENSINLPTNFLLQKEDKPRLD